MPAPSISLTVRVLTAVSRASVPLQAHEVARRLNCRCNTVRVILGRLVDRGDLVRTQRESRVLFGLSSTADDEPHIWDLTMSWRSKSS